MEQSSRLVALALSMALLPLSAAASSGGISGYSGQLNGVTCANCHTVSASTPVPTVVISGPTTLGTGATATYELTLSGGPGVRGGFNVSVDHPDAVLSGITGSSKALDGEVTQSAAAAFVNGSVKFQFTLTAPPAAGTIKLFGAGNSCDGSGVGGDRHALTTFSISVDAGGAPPTIAQPAATSTPTVTGTSAALTVLGADDGGEAQLSYTWALKSGPASVTFSPNGTNAAKNTTVTFSAAGDYVLEVQVRDAGNQQVTSTVAISVKQTLSALTVSPGTAAVPVGTTASFTAAAKDQFGDAYTPAPAITWTTTGGGTISSSGVFTAGSATGGPFIITASDGSRSGTAEVTVTLGTPPSVTTAPSATPNPVTGTSTQVQVLASDDGGEAALSYTWSVASGPATVTFTPNGTNAAKSAQAIFSSGGSYVLKVTVKDGTGQTSSASVPVTVAQTLTAIRISPASAGVPPGGVQPFSLNATDQFGASMPAPGTVTWNASGGGTISSSGVFTAGATAGGPHMISAQAGTLSATASVTVSAGTAPVVTLPPFAAQSPVKGMTTQLEVAASDDGGAAALTYTWSVVSGPAPVALAPNGDNAAQRTVATFAQAGTYLLSVSIADASNLTTTAQLTVDVHAVPARFDISPATSLVPAHGSQQFTVTAYDQFELAVFPTPSVIWTASGGGTINTQGLFRAGAVVGGPHQITASALGLSSSASVTIDTGAAPTLLVAATADPAVIAGRSTTLRALGTDEGGDAALIYDWAGTGPAAVTFSEDGTNAAKNTVATFGAAGSYTLSVTIRDADGMMVQSSVDVVVTQSVELVQVTPSPARVAPGGSLAFTATALDQFGAAHLAAPEIAWHASAGGTIDAAGIFTAHAASGGPYLVSATVGAVRGSAYVTVGDGTVDEVPPTIVAPTFGKDLLSGVVRVVAAVTDDSGIARVTFSVDGEAVGVVDAEPWAMGLDTTALVDGRHTLQIVAVDLSGKSAESQPVEFWVQNARALPPVAGMTDWKSLGCAASGANAEALLPLAILALLAVTARRRRHATESLQHPHRRGSPTMKRTIAIALLCAAFSPAPALGQTDGGTEFRERCARRVASTLLAQSPSSTLLASSDPQASIDAMLMPDSTMLADGGVPVTPFQERFARFVNAAFNADTGVNAAEDASYYLALHVLKYDLQWKELFIGPWRVEKDPNDNDEARVVADSAGLGYFRSRAWMVRYAGNEADGYRVVAAYRMMNNVLGVKLVAAQNTEGVDAASRETNPACSGCHYDPVFGLDYAAKILSRRSGTGSSMKFLAPTDGPQTFLGGQVISDDKQFVTAMVNSPDFAFRACRLAFEFVYGRPEFTCEGYIFDKCINAFNATGKITDAIRAVTKDATFCQ